MNISLVAYISLAFILFKIIDSKYISKKQINSKELVKSTAYVAVSIVLGNYLNDKFNPIIDKKNIDVFTSEPKF